ncbi:hypothetical protein GYA44_00365 [Candidatus Microgenomates bacterium]|nr:hypothetical protein [Candidatus Microgenomates bacterium]
MFKLLIRLAYFAAIFVEGLIILRIILKLINASLENTFASWVVNMSSMFITPFDGIVSSTLQINKIEIELTSLVALLFYIIAAFVLSELLKSFSKE